jgi:hypothetical protein
MQKPLNNSRIHRRNPITRRQDKRKIRPRLLRLADMHQRLAHTRRAAPDNQLNLRIILPVEVVADRAHKRSPFGVVEVWCFAVAPL